MTRAPVDRIEALYRDERGWMEHRAARIVGPAEAPDVVQTVFLRVWARTAGQVVAQMAGHMPPQPGMAGAGAAQCRRRSLSP